MSERRDPSLWVGINVENKGVTYFGRESRGLEELTYGGQWYRHYGQDADGCWLYRLPRWWHFGKKPRPFVGGRVAF